jgi:protein phosphatase
MADFHGADTAEFSSEDVLGKHFGPSPPPVHVEFGARSHPGLVRPNNEDHYVVIERRRSRCVLLTNLPEGALQPRDDKAYIFAVADGMGGAAFGEIASMMALRSGWEQAPQAIKWTWIINDREIEDLKERVQIVFERMHQALREKAQADPTFAGMGTTLTSVYTVGREAFIGHVGDSRAYLYRQGTLTQLTRDHTLAQQALDAGLPIASRSWYHMLTNCLGANDQPVQVEFHHFGLADGDRLLLCTDGLTDLVRDDEVAGVLYERGKSQEASALLVDLALNRGGRDNVTVIVARYEMDAAPP